MCGIVGALAQRNVSSILLEGLYRLEYRGYDSAGMALIEDHKLERFRALGKVSELEARMSGEQPGHIGIAHTRWATHGAPSETNAHPHFSSDRVAVVHNGIIENYKGIRERLLKAGYEFSSETDSEVVAHLIDSYFKDDLFVAVKKAVDELEGHLRLALLPSMIPIPWLPAGAAIRWWLASASRKTLLLPMSLRCCPLPTGLSISKRVITSFCIKTTTRCTTRRAMQGS